MDPALLMDAPNPLTSLLRNVGSSLRHGSTLSAAALRALRSSGLTVPMSPLSGVRIGLDLFVHGVSPAIGWAISADRHPGDTAAIDEHGVRLTFQEGETLTRQAATVLAAHGLRHGRNAAILGRNSVGFAVAIAAVPRTGADLIYLNTGFSPDQIEDILRARRVHLVLADPELADRVPAGVQVLDLPDVQQWGGVRPTSKHGHGRHVILTSGTTGRPKGADRSRTPLEAAVSLLDALPYQERATMVMAAPMFHSWGWLNHRLSSLLDMTEIMVGRPKAEAVLDTTEQYGAELVVTTPVVIRRLTREGPGRRDLSALRGVLVSGAPIPPDVVASFQDQFGPVLYNLYGSTEVGYATVASPADLRAAPTTAGRVLPGVTVEIMDRSGNPLPVGTEGEVWVGSSAAFDGYMDGADKDRRGALVSTGDLGRFDPAGRLFISGRTDDLIISGGENVHPTEIEAVLRLMAELDDVAAVGRTDPEFGQRVVAYVVPAAGVDRAGLTERVEAFARANLAGFQRPRQVVLLDSLPRNATGKVLRREL